MSANDEIDRTLMTCRAWRRERVMQSGTREGRDCHIAGADARTFGLLLTAPSAVTI